MKTSEKFSFGTNKIIKILITALLQITFYITIIGLFEYILVVMNLSSKTPKKIIYIEAFILYLLGRVANTIVDIFKGKKENDKNKDDTEDRDDENDEDFF